MYKCNYCDKQLKSEGGRKRHENSCKMKSNEEESTIQPITLEIVGEGNYYIGHPRRLIKLNGLRSRTHDSVERLKIERMIIELRNA